MRVEFRNWWKRRATRFTAATAGVIAAFVGFTQVRFNATADGDPYSVPSIVDTNPDPNIVETTITAEAATVHIGNGVMAHVLTFNGTLPGPEFRLKVGDTVIVHFKNNIEHDTGIHWHGIELASASDGTPLVQNQVPPGGEFLYKFTVTRPGIYWYHPHHHSSTNQVFKGLYGSIIVEDPNEAALRAAGVIPGPAQTKTVVLSDLTVCKAVGSNDAITYDPSLPHVSGGPLPAQGLPFPVTICETSPIDEDGNARGPYLAGEVPNIQLGGSSGTVNEGQTVLTNGMNVGGRAGDPSAPGALAAGAYSLDVQAGQGLRLQLINTATTRFFRLRLTDAAGTQIPLVRIGGQGGLLDSARIEGGVAASGFDFKYGSGEILIDPGDRADVVAAIPADASGVLTMWTQDFSRTGGGFAKIPTVPVMHLNVTGSAGSAYTIAAGAQLRARTGDLVEALGPATGTLLNPATFSPSKLGMATQDIRLTNASNTLGINGDQGSHDFDGDYTLIPHEGSTRYAKLGDTLELQVTNATGAHHPFHLHGFSIQPLELIDTISGPNTPGPEGFGPSYTFPYREFRDNIDVPAGYTLRYRMRLDDRPLMDGTTLGGGVGRWVFHCHIFFHATFGMISEFVVTAPDGNERPNVNTNGAGVVVNEGQTATVTGTYHDPDGDTVTLSGPSLGTLTDNGNGTWSWSLTSNDGVSRLMFVTATDSHGLKSQTAFSLVVNNLAPTIDITTPVTGSVFPAGTTVSVIAAVTHPTAGEPLTCTFNWDGGGATATTTASGGSCTRSNTFTAPGVYTVAVSVADSDGDIATDTVAIIVFDPSAGFVSGGGSIDSPAGAFTADPTLNGPATFGFYSRYRRGATVPSGETEFDFKAGNFKFRSTSYQWLVVSGARAQYKGVGQVNGAGTFGFLLTLVDGALPGGGGVDRFRLKVWDPANGGAIVYDNALGAPDDIDAAAPQAITSGSIVIHK